MSIVPAVPQVFAEFNVNAALVSTLVVSIWELGEGLGPFIVAPLSELFGRAPVYHFGNCLFVLCLVAPALSTNMPMLIIFRFLNGLSTTSLTLAPSIIGDLFIVEQRGVAMAIAISFQLVGFVGAPIIGSYIAQAKGWRWTIWVIAIAVGTLTCISFITIRETYYPVIQKRQTNGREVNVMSTSQDLQPQGQKYGLRSLQRPLRMLFFSPIVFMVSFYTALTYGMSYLVMTTLTEIFEGSYGFSQGAVGLLFLGQGLLLSLQTVRPILTNLAAAGMVLSVVLYGVASDVYLTYRSLKEGKSEPESRLLFMIIGSVLLPIGFLVYGWTLQYRIVWIVPIIGTALIGANVFLAQLPTENYLVDVYGDFAASAIAIGVVLRATTGALLPLAGPPLYKHLGYAWGNSLLGFLAAAFVPVVVSLFSLGHRMQGNRQRWED